MRKWIVIVLAALTAACSSEQPPAQTSVSSQVTQAPQVEVAPSQPEAQTTRPAVPSKDHFKNFGVAGSMFRIKSGEIEGVEGGLFYFHTVQNTFWAVDMEAEMSPLDNRTIYFIRLKIDHPCGPWLPQFREAPPECVAEEVIVPWPAAKKRLRRGLSSEAYEWVEKQVEPFLRRRS